MGGLILLVLTVIGLYFIYKRIKYCRGIKVNFPPGLEDIHSNPENKPDTIKRISEENKEKMMEGNYTTVDSVKKEELVSEPKEPKPVSEDKIQTPMFQSSGYIIMPSRQTEEMVDNRVVFVNDPPRYVQMKQFCRDNRGTESENPPSVRNFKFNNGFL